MDTNQIKREIYYYCKRRFKKSPVSLSLLSKVDNKNKVFKIGFKNKTYLLKLFLYTKHSSFRRCKTEKEIAALIEDKVPFKIPEYAFDKCSLGFILLRHYINRLDLKKYLIDRLRKGKDINLCLGNSIKAIRRVHKLFSFTKFGTLWHKGRFKNFHDFIVHEDIYYVCGRNMKEFLTVFQRRKKYYQTVKNYLNGKNLIFPKAYHLCHGDLSGHGFLISKKGRIKAMIDWENAIFSDPVRDFAQYYFNTISSVYNEDYLKKKITNTFEKYLSNDELKRFPFYIGARALISSIICDFEPEEVEWSLRIAKKMLSDEIKYKPWQKIIIET
nr:hypothetical protein [Nanoarchaeum sp.]